MTNPNEMVFPQMKQVGNVAIAEGGLTKREWFAGMALQGMFSVNGGWDAQQMSSFAYEYADAMLKEGGK